MEEDIKILEEWVEVDRKTRNYSKESDFDKFCEEKNVAIENLIKGYRELEYKYNKALTDLSIECKRTNEENYRCSLFAVENNDLKEKLANSIPKSKIREKIGELSKIKGDFATYIATSERIKVLQELLEEEV